MSSYLAVHDVEATQPRWSAEAQNLLWPFSSSRHEMDQTYNSILFVSGTRWLFRRNAMEDWSQFDESQSCLTPFISSHAIGRNEPRHIWPTSEKIIPCSRCTGPMRFRRVGRRARTCLALPFPVPGRVSGCRRSSWKRGRLRRG